MQEENPERKPWTIFFLPRTEGLFKSKYRTSRLKFPKYCKKDYIKPQCRKPQRLCHLSKNMLQMLQAQVQSWLSLNLN